MKNLMMFLWQETLCVNYRCITSTVVTLLLQGTVSLCSNGGNFTVVDHITVLSHKSGHFSDQKEEKIFWGWGGCK